MDYGFWIDLALDIVSAGFVITGAVFVLAGAIMNVGGITARLFTFAASLVGHFRGGLAHVKKDGRKERISLRRKSLQ